MKCPFKEIKKNAGLRLISQSLKGYQVNCARRDQNWEQFISGSESVWSGASRGAGDLTWPCLTLYLGLSHCLSLFLSLMSCLCHSELFLDSTVRWEETAAAAVGSHLFTHTQSIFMCWCLYYPRTSWEDATSKTCLCNSSLVRPSVCLHAHVRLCWHVHIAQQPKRDTVIWIAPSWPPAFITAGWRNIQNSSTPAAICPLFRLFCTTGTLPNSLLCLLEPWQPAVISAN